MFYLSALQFLSGLATTYKHAFCSFGVAVVLATGYTRTEVMHMHACIWFIVLVLSFSGSIPTLTLERLDECDP